MNAATARGYFLIGHALRSFFKFICARAREHRMRVGIDKARQNHATAGVNDLAVFVNQFFDF